jgi:predicted CopG family antitoxin
VVNETVRIDLVGVQIVYNATSGFNETVEVNRTTWSTFPVTLADGRNGTRPYTFRVKHVGLWKVPFLRFKDGDVSSAYRELHLRIRSRWTPPCGEYMYHVHIRCAQKPMETKTIALDREAYDLLRRQKRKGESFSDAVKRIAREGRPLSDFSGAWKKHLSGRDIRAIEAAIRRGREADRDRTGKLIARLG